MKSGTDAGKTCAKNGPFSLSFCQIVALMLPHLSAFEGLLCFLLVEMKLALAQEEESRRTVHGGRRRRAGEE